MRTLRGLASLLAVLLSLAARADETLLISLSDAEGKPVPEAVVMVKTHAMAQQSVSPPRVEVDLADERFEPRVVAIAVGSEVVFLNSDKSRHHLYSFSPAKSFELNLSSDSDGMPVLFDKPGVIKLGCNIHEDMRGYVVASESPFFGVSNRNGEMRIKVVETKPVPGVIHLNQDGREALVWHRQMNSLLSITLQADESGRHHIELPITLEEEAPQIEPSQLKERLQRYRR